jgi:hypothetical protein
MRIMGVPIVEKRVRYLRFRGFNFYLFISLHVQVYSPLAPARPPLRLPAAVSAEET